jgi:hypothetical protein
MNTKVLVIAMVGTLLLPVLPLVAGLIAGLGKWPSHAMPRTAAGPAAEDPVAEKAAA